MSTEPGALVAQLDRLGGEPTALSPREAEVATLVAEGLTNRQIAERLFISERTAQNHVQHILTKLGFAAWGALEMSKPLSHPADSDTAGIS